MWSHPILYNGCNDSTMLGLKLIHVIKRARADPWRNDRAHMLRQNDVVLALPWCDHYVAVGRQRKTILVPLQWRHNGHDNVSNYQPNDCLLNCLFRRRSKKTSKLRVTGFCAGIRRGPVNSRHKWPVTRKMFPFDDVIMHWICDDLLTHRGPVDLRKWAIFNTILMSPKSWLSQEDLYAGCEHSMVPMDS